MVRTPNERRTVFEIQEARSMAMFAGKDRGSPVRGWGLDVIRFSKSHPNFGTKSKADDEEMLAWAIT